MRTVTAYAFTCECRGPCKRRLHLSAEAYARMASRGYTVLHVSCAAREGRYVAARYGEVVSCPTSEAVGAVV